MSETQVHSIRVPKTPTLPGYLLHASFKEKRSLQVYDPAVLLDSPVNYDDRYMPDDVTRDHAQRMHYSAHRVHTARTPADRTRWLNNYHALRDQIVLGNRKLIYRAVRRRMSVQNQVDDLIGQCHIVLIQAVAAYNPWMGIRFSTYAYTCLIRALVRLSQRSCTDRLSRSISLDRLPEGEPFRRDLETNSLANQFPVEDYLRADHPLLSDREKLILTHRFANHDATANSTLERVGTTLGLSKERVRQVQASAIEKLRKALSEG
jgi:RNA polymerase sigma factor (sigma-70 family)